MSRDASSDGDKNSAGEGVDRIVSVRECSCKHYTTILNMYVAACTTRSDKPTRECDIKHELPELHKMTYNAYQFCPMAYIETLVHNRINYDVTSELDRGIPNMGMSH